MSAFGEYLKELREELGHSSARSFHAWLSEQGELGCNYSYYSRLESGEVLPSATLANTMAGILGGAHADELILAYCRALFPGKKTLFPARAAAATASPQKEGVVVPTSRKRTLSPRQVAALSASKRHYLLFLIATLSRRELSLEEIETRIPGQPLKAVFAELKETKIIKGDLKSFSAACHEMKFPPGETSELKATYAKLDSWDQQIAQDLDLHQQVKRFLFRRVSKRYVGMIQAHCALLLDLIRGAEDVDPAHNDEVVSFNLNLYVGKIPG